MKYLLKNKKRVLFVVIILILTVFAFYYIYDNSTNHDTLMIKDKYESLNGVIVDNTDNETYQKIYIKSNAPIKNITAKEAVSKIKKEEGIIFIGYSKCPWCRNALPVLIDVAMEENKEILYLDASTLRDEYKVEEGKLKKTKKASKYYYELLELCDQYLEDYKVYDEEQNEFDTKEKRIYVPLVASFKDGKVLKAHTGTVELLKDQSVFDTLNDNQKDDLKKIYSEIIDEINSNMCTATGC